MLSKLNQSRSYVEFALAAAERAWYRRTQVPGATILMFHHIAARAEGDVSAYADLFVTPEEFEALITRALDSGSEFVSLDAALADAGAGERMRKGQQFVLSIDDGYRDTYENAFPILEKHGIPFVFYVSPAFPNKTIILWWNYLNELVSENAEVTLRDGRRLACDTPESKLRVYVSLCKSILRMGANMSECFPQVFGTDLEHLRAKYAHLLIDWAQVQEMSRSPLCSVGSHTRNHLGARFCQRQLLLREFEDSRAELRERLGVDAAHMAYPFGTHYSVGWREYKIARAAGFKTAAVTFPGVIHPYHVRNPYSLPRVAIRGADRLPEPGSVR